MADNIGKALDFLIGPDQIACPVADLVLQIGIDAIQLHLGRLHLAQIPHHHPGDDAGQHQDQYTGQGVDADRCPGGPFRLLPPRRPAFFLDLIDGGDFGPHLIHQFLAASLADDADGITGPLRTTEGDGRFHDADPLARHLAQAIHPVTYLCVLCRQVVQRLHQTRQVAHGLVMDGQELLAARQQIAALAGLGVDQADQQIPRGGLHPVAAVHGFMEFGGATDHEEGREVHDQQQHKGQRQQAQQGPSQPTGSQEPAEGDQIFANVPLHRRTFNRWPVQVQSRLG